MAHVLDDLLVSKLVLLKVEETDSFSVGDLVASSESYEDVG